MESAGELDLRGVVTAVWLLVKGVREPGRGEPEEVSRLSSDA